MYNYLRQRGGDKKQQPSAKRDFCSAYQGNASALQMLEEPVRDMNPVIQFFAENWEDYVKRMDGNFGSEEFPYCRSECAKATWDPPDTSKDFDCHINMHVLSEKSNKWKECGHVQVVLDRGVLMFHTQSNGGNVGVATILFPAVLQWVSDLKKTGTLMFSQISMNPAGGAASKTVIELLSHKIGEAGHRALGDAAKQRRKASDEPRPANPNQWSTAYNEEFAEYIYSLKDLGSQGLDIGSEGFKLVGNLDYNKELLDYIPLLKENSTIAPSMDITQIDGESEFEKLLTLFKARLSQKAKKGDTLAGSQISIAGPALDLVMGDGKTESE